jgi:hypothetical protein
MIDQGVEGGEGGQREEGMGVESVGEEHPIPECRQLLDIKEYTTSISRLGKHS